MRLPSDATLDPARRATMRSILEEAVAAEEPRRARFRVPVAVGVGAAVTLAGGTAAAYVITQRPVTEDALVHCLSRAEMAPNGEYPGSAVAVAAPRGETAPVNDAIDACAQLWRDGLLDPDAAIGAALPEPTASRAAVPSPMAVCVTPDGAAAVVPGTAHTCAELDLPVRQP